MASERSDRERQKNLLDKALRQAGKIRRHVTKRQEKALQKLALLTERKQETRP